MKWLLLTALLITTPALAFKSGAATVTGDLNTVTVLANGNCQINDGGANFEIRSGDATNPSNTKAMGQVLCRLAGAYQTAASGTAPVGSTVGRRWTAGGAYTNDIDPSTAPCRVETAGPAKNGASCGSADP